MPTKTNEGEDEDIVISDNYDDDTPDTNSVFTPTQEKVIDEALNTFTQKVEEYLDQKTQERIAEVLMKISAMIYADYRDKFNVKKLI